MDTKLAQEFASLSERKKFLEAQVKEINTRLAEINEQLIEMFAEDGIQRITVQAGTDEYGNPLKRTVYISRMLWLGYADAEDGNKAKAKQNLIDALKRAGYGEFISEGFNSNSVSTIVRELDPDNNTPLEILQAKLPQEIRPYAKVTEKVQAKTVKA